jgi:flagellar biosynthesis protein FliR
MLDAHFQASFHVGSLLWLRCAPLFALIPFLAVGAVPGLGALALCSALAGALTPLVLQGCRADAGCAASLASELSWAGAGFELLMGLCIALGIGLPCLALRSSGAIALGLMGVSAEADSTHGRLGSALGFGALVAASQDDLGSGVAELLLQPAPQLSAAHLAPEQLGPLLLALGLQLIRAIELGVTLAAPLLLGAVLLTFSLGLLGRAVGPRFTALGPSLLPWLGVGLVSVCVANWLELLPQLVRSFAQTTMRLFSGLP